MSNTKVFFTINQMSQYKDLKQTIVLLLNLKRCSGIHLLSQRNWRGLGGSGVNLNLSKDVRHAGQVDLYSAYLSVRHRDFIISALNLFSQLKSGIYAYLSSHGNISLLQKQISSFIGSKTFRKLENKSNSTASSLRDNLLVRYADLNKDLSSLQGNINGCPLDTDKVGELVLQLKRGIFQVNAELISSKGALDGLMEVSVSVGDPAVSTSGDTSATSKSPTVVSRFGVICGPKSPSQPSQQPFRFSMTGGFGMPPLLTKPVGCTGLSSQSRPPQPAAPR